LACVASVWFPDEVFSGPEAGLEEAFLVDGVLDAAALLEARLFGELLAEELLPAAVPGEERSIEKTCVPEESEELPELERLLPDEGAAGEGAEMSNATSCHSVSPRALGALVGFNLFAPLCRSLLLGPEALDHLPDRFGALRRALPGLVLAVALCTSPCHELILLPHGLFESREECLVVPGHRPIDARYGPLGEATHIAFEVALQLAELRLAFRDAALTQGQRFRAAPLLIVHDALNHLESLCSFHGLRLLR